MNESAVRTMTNLLDSILQAGRLDLHLTVDRKAGPPPLLTVEFTGGDVPMLLARHAELLLALEHVAAKVLGLESEEHEQISFDAGGFKGGRARSLERDAERALAAVRATGRPYRFPPMSSRERRMLHLRLNRPGFVTGSEGEGPRRHLIVRPA